MSREGPFARKAYELPGPHPLMPKRAPFKPYPVDELGDVLGPATRAIAAKVQCAEALAAQSVLGVASLAAQALADVLLPFSQTRPLSLFLLTIAESGDRKSSADKEAIRPVRKREEQLRDEYEPLVKGHAIALTAWRGQSKHIERSGKLDLTARREALEALGPEPAAPLLPRLKIDESTAEGLARHMPTLPGAIGIFSAEGGQFLNGHGFSDEAKIRTAASFCSLWDGNGLRRLRAGDGLTDLRGRRLAAHLMIQPDVATLVLKDPILRDQGLLSRFLIAAPESLAGTRLWQEPSEGIEPTLRKYFGCMLSVFETVAPAANTLGNELRPRRLGFSTDGRAVWIKFHDEVEHDMRPGGWLEALHDVAGKAAEQAARIAGVLAIVDAPASNTISEAAMTRGCNLMRWYLDEALRLAEAVEVAQEVEDAQALLDWLHKQAASYVTATMIQKSGPNRLRQKARMDPAIEALEAAGWLKVDDTSRRAWRVHPKPRKPQPQPPQS